MSNEYKPNGLPLPVGCSPAPQGCICPPTLSPEAIVRAAFDQRQREEAIVRAALERAISCCDAELRNTAMLLSNPPKSSAAWDSANSIRRLADDPKNVAAIIAAAKEGRG